MRACSWCHEEHEWANECAQQKAAYADMKRRNEERRKQDMEEGRDWPPAESVRRNWTAHGLKCSVAQGYMLCGYVHVPEGHPAERGGYDDVEVDVHGGLTFRCKAKEGGSWFGFDTSHFDDWQPGVPGVTLDRPGRIWTEDDVAAETERLAGQLAAMKSDSK